MVVLKTLYIIVSASLLIGQVISVSVLSFEKVKFMEEKDMTSFFTLGDSSKKVNYGD